MLRRQCLWGLILYLFHDGNNVNHLTISLSIEILYEGKKERGVYTINLIMFHNLINIIPRGNR